MYLVYEDQTTVVTNYKGASLCFIYPTDIIKTAVKTQAAIHIVQMIKKITGMKRMVGVL